MANEKKKNGLLKLTILSISLMLSAASAIAVTLPMIKEQFPSIDPATVESLVTVPSFTMMVFILLSSFIIKAIGKKNTVILGLTLAFIGGVIPVFATDFNVIYISRFVLGAGTGIYNSLAISLIGEYYQGEEQKKMLGYQQAFSTLGSSFSLFLAGILVNISWQYSYLVYFLTLPIIVFVFFFLPKEQKQITEGTKEEKVKEKQTINSLVVFSCVIMFLFFALIMAIYTKTSTLIVEQNYQGQGFLGTALTISGLMGALTGFVYSYVRNFLKVFTPVVALGFVGAAYLLIPIAGNMTILAILLIFASLVVGLFIPYMYDILLPGAPANSVNLAVSLAMVSCNLGSFFSPYVLKLLGNIFNNSNTSFSFVVSGIVFIIMAFIFILTGFKKKSNSESMALD